MLSLSTHRDASLIEVGKGFLQLCVQNLLRNHIEPRQTGDNPEKEKRSLEQLLTDAEQHESLWPEAKISPRAWLPFSNTNAFTERNPVEEDSKPRAIFKGALSRGEKQATKKNPRRTKGEKTTVVRSDWTPSSEHNLQCIGLTTYLKVQSLIIILFNFVKFSWNSSSDVSSVYIQKYFRVVQSGFYKCILDRTALRQEARKGKL